jgi:Uma2 family endonuclease
MNAHHPLRMDKDTFLRWATQQQGRYELVRGDVTQMVSVSRLHMRVVMNLTIAIASRLDRSRYDIANGEFATQTGDDTIRLADVMVEPLHADGKATVTRAAVFIAEVLSPSSVYADLREKPAEYFALPNLQHYLVLSQDEPNAWSWTRRAEGWPNDAQALSDRDAQLELSALQITLPMAEIFRGIAA